MTDFSNICEILGDLYSNYKDDEVLGDFIKYNDLGLPLAYFYKEQLAEPIQEGIDYVNETWLIFLASIGAEDTGFNSLNEVFESVE